MSASTSPLPASDQALRGILLICAAVLLFVSHDGLSKFLSGFYPVVMVVWARYLVHTLLMAAVFVPRNGLTVIHNHRPLMQLARALCLIGTSLFFTTGLCYLPLAEATAMSLLAPPLVTALSMPSLREKVNLGQWLAVFTGFIGVLLIVRPGGVLFTPAASFPLDPALYLGLYQLPTRVLANSDSPTTNNFLAGIFNALIMNLLVLFFWQTPNLLHGLVMIVLGGRGMGDHLLLTQVFRHVPSATLVPFNYGQIISAGLLGLLVLGHVLDAWVLLGIPAICASGLVVAWRRGRRAQRGQRADFTIGSAGS